VEFFETQSNLIYHNNKMSDFLKLVYIAIPLAFVYWMLYTYAYGYYTVEDTRSLANLVKNLNRFYIKHERGVGYDEE